MIRPSLGEAMREKLATTEHLENIRQMYLNKMAKMSHKELDDLCSLFESKEREESAMLDALKEARTDYPRQITDELLATKSRKILLWSGLAGECRRRL